MLNIPNKQIPQKPLTEQELNRTKWDSRIWPVDDHKRKTKKNKEDTNIAK